MIFEIISEEASYMLITKTLNMIKAFPDYSEEMTVESASGLSVKDWCAQNNLSTKSFYYRRRQVQSMILDSAEESRFTELVMPELSKSNTDPRPILSAGMAFTPQLMISTGDLMFGVSQDTPRQLLTDVLQVIRNA